MGVVVNGYRRISLQCHEIEVPHVDLREHVDVHMVPDLVTKVMEVRICWQNMMVHSVALPLDGFTVHL